jgi:hypothetical protein
MRAAALEAGARGALRSRNLGGHARRPFPAGPRWILPGLLVLGVGCASTRPSAWDPAEPTHPPVAGRPKPTTKPLREVGARPGAPRDRALEVAIVGFGASRRQVAERWPPALAWPLDVQDVWLRHGARLVEELAPHHELSRRTLMQARVATEVELDLTTARYGPCPPEVAERLGRIFGLIAHHMQRARNVLPPPSDYLWPVSPVVVTSGFGHRQDPMTSELRMHKGVDLGGRQGDVVGAARRGTVVEAGWMGGYGKAVTILHDDGLVTLYGHLSEILVEIGAPLAAGDALGLMGSSGRSTAPHLHFEVRKNGEPIDPLDVLGLDHTPLTASLEGDDG